MSHRYKHLVIGYICIKKMLQWRTWCAVDKFIYTNIVRSKLHECAQNILWKNALYVGYLSFCKWLFKKIGEISTTGGHPIYIECFCEDIFWQGIRPGKWKLGRLLLNKKKIMG